MQAEVEVKVERRSDSFFLSLDLSLNLPECWWASRMLKKAVQRRETVIWFV
jgi:hypothetical protein